MTLSPNDGCDFRHRGIRHRRCRRRRRVDRDAACAIALAVIKATATAFYGQVYGVMSLLVAVCLSSSHAGGFYRMADPPPS